MVSAVVGHNLQVLLFVPCLRGLLCCTMILAFSLALFDGYRCPRLLDFVLRHHTVGSCCSERSQVAYSPNEDHLHATVTSLGKVANITPSHGENRGRDVCDIRRDEK